MSLLQNKVPRLPPWQLDPAGEAAFLPKSWAGTLMSGPNRYGWPIAWTLAGAAQSFATTEDVYRANAASLFGVEARFFAAPAGVGASLHLRPPRAVAVVSIPFWPAGDAMGMSDALTALAPQLTARDIFAGQVLSRVVAGDPSVGAMGGTTIDVTDLADFGTLTQTLANVAADAEKWIGGEVLMLLVSSSGYSATVAYVSLVDGVPRTNPNALAQIQANVRAAFPRFERVQFCGIFFGDTVFDNTNLTQFEIGLDMMYAGLSSFGATKTYLGRMSRAASRAPVAAAVTSAVKAFFGIP